MFTGIVQSVGTVKEVLSSGLIIGFGAEFRDGTLIVGESIAVNGTCLTAVAFGSDWCAFDLSPETFAKTSLGRLSVGGRVNLERAMSGDGRFGGHFMQGHVDGTGTVVSISPNDSSTVIRFQAPSSFDRYMIEKGSIAVDGISLTIVDLRDGAFDVWVVPHTLENTNLGDRKAGDVVNLEFDMLAKYFEKLLIARQV
ncbi:riboflavin synthase [soil metagenome]